MASGPNFVMFMTDQHRADFLGCSGHPVLRTPHIDRIAEDGIQFDCFHVASPVCMPNRSSIMTGRMPSLHGVRSNGIPLPVSSVTFVDLLREAGYRTALVGKSHLQNFTDIPPPLQRGEPPAGHRAPNPESRDPLRRDFTQSSYLQENPGFWSHPDAQVTTPFYGFDHVELVTGHGDDLGGDYRRWLTAQAPEARRLLGPRNALPQGYSCPQAVRTAIPEHLYPTAFIAERASAWLDLHRDHDAPFFLMVSFPDPHHPFNPPGRYWDMYRPDQFPVPEAFLRNGWRPPRHVASAIAQREQGTANLSGMGTVAVTAREAQEAQALTCGMITCIDDAVGSVMARVSAEDTVVLFTSDHGDHLGDHRLLLKGAEQYGTITRVPFLWSDPALRTGPSRTSAIASSIDIPATILDRAGLGAFDGMQGESFLEVMAGERTTHRDAAFIQYDHQREAAFLGHPPRVHTLVDTRWRISVIDGSPWGELYDLESDPGELFNLWDEPTRASDKARLLERLLRAEIACVDRAPMPTALA